jgi:hypothetical protein
MKVGIKQKIHILHFSTFVSLLRSHTVMIMRNWVLALGRRMAYGKEV